MNYNRGFIIPAPLIAFGLKYGLYFVAGIAAIAVITFAVRHYNESLRDQGRQEIRAKWEEDKRAREKETAKLVQAARDEERATQAKIQAGKDKADADRNELAKRLTAFERDNGRLRVNRASLCKPSVPRPAGDSGGNAQAAGNAAVGAGAGEIDLDDVARAIGSLGRDLDAANIRIVELIGVANACQRRSAVKP